MNQLVLSYIPYQQHSETSREAARSIKDCVHTLRAQVLAFIQMHSLGVSDDEIQSGLEISGSTERPRRVELQKLGLVVDSGRRRATASGRMAVIWITI